MKARDLSGSAALAPPGSHRLFSKLSFMFGKLFGDIDMLNESDPGESVDRSYEEEDQVWAPCKKQDHDGGWLEGDDIEEF